MKKITLLVSLFLSTSALAQFEITKESADLGQAQVVTLEKTNKFDLIGNAVKPGDLMPSVQLMTSDLKSYDTSAKNKTVKVYSILTSVDTPVCVQQAVDLSKYVKAHTNELKNIEFYAISADTPFAQQRFIKEHSLSDVTYLSDSAEHKFGLKTGSQIQQLGLLTRSIIVTDTDNIIIHIQRVPELTNIPDLEAAVKIARESL
ncbi:peroxiredoxin [Shewanella psychropiezotolerans]|uniref:Peroxiredoxin n=1 Tax=Shewanella psychropiezotolerans TaxID=2593655 RepID=A0ABX5X4S9_9GAMM|nr:MULTISPECIES: peroxiredoxin [Shewanella]MPY25669.1 peroxiredoxin [Shewanella sp. YLB-07]QDO86360.1 peroxiredoxin [Shewanella psychropiezotolerans]